MPVNIDTLLARNHSVAASEPHIIPIASVPAPTAQLLIAACPAGRFSLNASGELRVDHYGCLECGACRLLCSPETFSQWHYPTAGHGLTVRYG